MERSFYVRTSIVLYNRPHYVRFPALQVVIVLLILGDNLDPCVLWGEP